jgi:uncharacterized protein (DUF1800 family)
MKVWASLAAVTLAAASPLATASVHDHIFGNHFDPIADLPANSNEAARFLTQATFGPTSADISKVMHLGYSEWIDEQLGLSPTLEYNTVEAVKTAHAGSPSQSYRLNRWYWQAVYAPDQLRQRMAFALSQIFVVSDQDSAINQDVAPMSSYQDMLAKDAFGYYSSVLTDVTYHPTMGKYLNAFHNVAPICSGSGPTLVCTTSPDENYAREVMQLFSVGLVLLNMDGSHVTGEIPTYDQNIITNTAEVFTGFTFGDAPTGIGGGPPANFGGGGSTDAGASLPMLCFGNEYFSNNNPQMKHDVNGDGEVGGVALTVLGTNGVPSDTQIPNTVTPGTCGAEVAYELSVIASHPNVPPFISRQLIQRFVTSNPSPAYIQRVATVMDTAGNDLGDVIKAILTDDEARNPPALANGDSYGKLREPVLRLTAMWRAFNAKAPAPDVPYGEIKMIGGGNFQSNFGQNPLEAPTVFNFYLPDYQQPGLNGLYSPEFQITNASTTYTTANTYYGFTAQGYQGYTSGTPPVAPVDRPLIDLSSLTQGATSDAQVNVANMVSTINSTMLYGSMSSAMSTSLTNMLTQLKAGGTGGPTEMAWSAIYVTMLSPEYATQR